MNRVARIGRETAGLSQFPRLSGGPMLVPHVFDFAGHHEARLRPPVGGRRGRASPQNERPGLLARLNLR
jgi:hypothetical protein